MGRRSPASKGASLAKSGVERRLGAHFPKAARADDQREEAELIETYSEGLTERQRIRTVSKLAAARGADALADPFSEPAKSRKIRQAPAPRRQGALKAPAQTNSAGETVSNCDLPEFMWEATLAEKGKNGHLLRLIEQLWLPMAWAHYERAGLPLGDLVFVHDLADGSFAPESDHRRPLAFDVYPAWRLPALFRFEVGSPESMAGELIYIASALRDDLAPVCAPLRSRFADDPDDLAPLDRSVLSARGAELFAALQVCSPWDGHPTRKTIIEAAREGARSDQKSLDNKLGPEWPLIVRKLKAAYEAGSIGSRLDYARIVLDELNLEDISAAKKRVERYEKLGLIVQVRGSPGRRAKSS
jgi:hypothetical protein